MKKDIKYHLALGLVYLFIVQIIIFWVVLITWYLKWALTINY